MDTYLIPAGSPVKVARTGQPARDHRVRRDTTFTCDELVTDPDRPPTDDSAPARWARRGWYVFRLGHWYLLVEGMNVQIAY